MGNAALPLELVVTEIEHSGKYVSDSLFGANVVFSQSVSGRPTAALDGALDVLGVNHLRFGGGESDLNPATGAVDGVDRINIVTMNGGQLRPELVNFLEYCRAEGNTLATLVLPTKHLDVGAYVAFGQEITDFVNRVMRDYGDVIEAFQIGNEYWEMGETAYGQKASIAAVAIEAGLERAGIPEARQPNILVQMATAGAAGSEFQATPGGLSFGQRNDAANQQIIGQLSGEARAAIDGVTEHYYYNKEEFQFSDHPSAMNYISRDYDQWSRAFDKDLELVITEWNVKSSSDVPKGMVAGGTLLQQVGLMADLGVDAAHIWALDYHSRNALTLDTDGGARLDAAGRLTNSAQGAAFDLMADTLPGAELLTLSFGQSQHDIAFNGYAVDQGYVLYIASRSLEVIDLDLDLSRALPRAASVSGVQVHLDQGSSNGRQWEAGVRADSVLVEGQPYFYNEHDTDVYFRDVSEMSADAVSLELKPFEFVELRIDWLSEEEAALPGTVTPPPDPQGAISRIGQDAVDDIIALYVAYFNRAPDAGGLQFWANAYQNGLSIEGMAAAFVDQPETRALYPSGTSDAAFVAAVYLNVLGRVPDGTGLTFWAGALQSGAVSRDGFILELLRGVEASPPPDASGAFLVQLAQDRAYLQRKLELGAEFAIDRGMTEAYVAAKVMSVFDGSDAGFAAARALLESFDTGESGDLVGVSDSGQDGFGFG